MRWRFWQPKPVTMPEPEEEQRHVYLDPPAPYAFPNVCPKCNQLLGWKVVYRPAFETTPWQWTCESCGFTCTTKPADATEPDPAGAG